MRLVIVGGGFTGMAVAERFRSLAVARATRVEVAATTRSPARADALREAGVTPLVAPALTPDALAPYVDDETFVVVTMPPDGTTDARLAPALRHAAALAYVSSTGVYGNASGRVDEQTSVAPPTPPAPRAHARVDAERVWRAAGATIVRAPAIYGPGRGLHLRLARGDVRLAKSGTNAISRVHVEDLAAALVECLLRKLRGDLFVIGDDEPAPHIDVVGYLCEALGIPLPAIDPSAKIDETLSHDRRIDPSRIARALGFTPAYPTYREGYTQCIAKDRDALDQALASRVGYASMD